MPFRASHISKRKQCPPPPHSGETGKGAPGLRCTTCEAGTTCQRSAVVHAHKGMLTVPSTYISHVWPTLISDPMLDLDIQELASLTAGGGDLENFERLFSKLKEMKGNCLVCLNPFMPMLF